MRPLPSQVGSKVLFIRTDRLGETLLTLPAVAALKRASPQSSIVLLVQPDLKALLEDVPELTQVLDTCAVRRGPWWWRAMRLARGLRRMRFDVAIVSNPKKEWHLAVWLAGIPVRAGYDRKWGGLLTHRVPDRKALGESHEVEYNFDLVRAIGVSASLQPWQFPRFEREQRDAFQLLEQQGIKASKPFIAIHPWSSNVVKRWPIDRYRVLLHRLVQRGTSQLVLIGGPEEEAQVASALAPGAPIANVVGRLSLRQLAGLLQCARLLVSNDSGPVHLAAALGTPTVVLFGTSEAATGPRRWGPWGDHHTVIWKPSMDAISIEDVENAIQQALRSP